MPGETLEEALSIKADWGFTLDAPVVQPERTYDPLDDATYAAPIPPIDLSTPEPELREHLKSLVSMEADLYNQGVECPIKCNSEATCLACPIGAKRDHSTPHGRLCRIGMEQERVLTVLKAKFANLEE